MNHTLRILSLAFICLVAPTFAADPKTKPKGEVIEFGTFELVGPQLTAPNAKTLDGAERNAPAARFTRQTDKVPAEIGVQFGFRFKLTSIPEATSVDLKTVVKHPPIMNEQGAVEREYTLTTTLSVADGYVSEVTGYSLDRPEELVHGVWVFEHWYHGQKLVSQSFTVIAVDNPPTSVPEAPKFPKKGIPFLERYRIQVEPILAKIEPTLPTKSVPELFEMFAGWEAMMPDNKGGKFTAFLPADSSWDVISDVSIFGNRLIIKELSKRLPSERKVFEEYKNKRDTRYDRAIYAGANGVSPTIRSICKDLLESGHSE